MFFNWIVPIITIILVTIFVISAYWNTFRQEFRFCQYGLFKPGSSLSSYFIVCLLAFNVNKQTPRSEMADLFDKQICCDRTPDVFAITLTELKYGSNAYRDYVKDFFETIGYEQLAYTREMRTSLGVYVRKENFLKFSDVKHKSILLDSIMKPTLVHKAACYITFQFNGVSFAFVGSHLSAHDEGNEKRIEEYGKIVRKFKLDHDYQFWMGDLNFRLEGISRAEVEDSIAKNDWSHLIKKDQLSLAQQNEKAFIGFQEGPINFAPTFKFDIGNDTYSRKRTPSYTDRILCKSFFQQYVSESRKNLVGVQVGEYDALHDINTSDHKPVRALAMIPNEAFLVKKDMNGEHLDMRTVSKSKRNSILRKFVKFGQVVAKYVT